MSNKQPAKPLALSQSERIAFEALRTFVKHLPNIAVPRDVLDEDGVEGAELPANEAVNVVPTPNLNPFSEAQGLTQEVENFAPVAAVMSSEDAMKTIQAMHAALNSGNVATVRKVLHTAASIGATIKGLFSAIL